MPGVTPDPARHRWLAIQAVRASGTAGAILGLYLLGRAVDLPSRVLGLLIVLAAPYVVLAVPRALAHRWRSDA
jgi:hypothetical protein